MTSSVLKFLRPALKAAAKVVKKPTDVDSVLSTLNRTIVDLDAVREAKVAEADKHKSDAAQSEFLGAAAIKEANRAANVHANLSKLVA